MAASNDPPPATGPRPLAGDVGARAAREDEQAWLERLAETLFGVESLGLVLVDEQGRIMRANEFFGTLAGPGADAVQGMPLGALLDVDTTAPASEGRPSAAWPAKAADITSLVARDGTRVSVVVETRHLTGPEGECVTLVACHDVSWVLQATGDLASQVRFDQDTGALARSSFRDQVDAELAAARGTGRSAAVLWIDLDGFKAVNDRHGHQVGDTVLVEVANRLHRAARRSDPVGRLGGDEFAVLVRDIDRAEALDAFAERVAEALREPIAITGGSIFVSGSIGIAVAPEDGGAADALLHAADTARYAAKGRGGDTHEYFRASMNEVGKARATLRQQLAAAIRGSSFCMHYQPIFEVATGRPVMIEALLRWRRQDGLVPAIDFIAMAQQTGQMRALGQPVLDLLEADLSRIDAEPDLAGLPVSFNLSVEELGGRDITSRLLQWRPSGGLGRLTVEVTESSLLPEHGRPVETVRLLSQLGAQVCIDDFGTGYSNLSQLDALRPALIKTDRSLLRDAETQPVRRAVLGAAVQLCHAVDARAVVEGVETAEELALIAELQADFAQGWHLAAPMDLEVLIPWLRDHGWTASR